MYKAFIEYIERNQLFRAEEKILLAISGGMDSMALLHLFERSGFSYGVVHCNFHLRGEESNKDEVFVTHEVHQHGVPSFFRSFNTTEYARECGISIEMAARELRYAYFEEVRREGGYSYIATAHHQEDQIETFFMNLSRKTGLKGLSGIKVKNERIIRPLLFSNRNQIKHYVQDNFIEFRTDSSNTDIVFQRNFIRHKILPLFDELNPAFRSNLVKSMANLKEEEEFNAYYLNREIDQIAVLDNYGAEIKIEALQRSKFPQLVLFHFLQKYNFNPTVIQEIYDGLESLSGKQFYSKSHRLVKDRDSLFVSACKGTRKEVYYIEEDDLELFEPLDLIIEKIGVDDFEMVKDSHTACLDRDKIDFPLMIRHWHQGDYFRPLGMQGFKKVSDFFIDNKVPLHEKENIWMLCSGEHIVWIMNMRLDDRYKVTDETREILQIKINN